MNIATTNYSELQAKAAHLSLDYNAELLTNSTFLAVFEAVLSAASHENSYELLQKIAYDNIDHTQTSITRNIHPAALRIALYSKTRNISDIASTLLRTVESQLKVPAPASKNLETTFPTWAEKNSCTDEKITVTWGGGERFLAEFLEGSSIGYANEAGGKGMFVNTSPAMKSRDELYACRTPVFHFDNPCIIEAEIDPKLLLQVNGNSYEAVLPKSAVPHLRIVKKEVWNLTTLDFAMRKKILSDTLPAARRDFKTGITNWKPILEIKAEGKYSAERIDRLSQAYKELE